MVLHSDYERFKKELVAAGENSGDVIKRYKLLVCERVEVSDYSVCYNSTSSSLF